MAPAGLGQLARNGDDRRHAWSTSLPDNAALRVAAARGADGCDGVRPGDIARPHALCVWNRGEPGPLPAAEPHPRRASWPGPSGPQRRADVRLPGSDDLDFSGLPPDSETNPAVQSHG